MKLPRFAFLIPILGGLPLFGARPVVDVDLGRTIGTLRPFWNSTGFSPADVLAAPEMRAVVNDDAGIARRGLLYIRPHYLLNLVVARGMGGDSPTYDWSRLDRSLDLLNRAGFRLIFELMGFPSDGTGGSANQYDRNFQEQLVHRPGYFDDLRLPGRIDRWRVFIAALAKHLEGRYGQAQVRSWLFESTNEPNLRNFWRYDIPTFLDYYDACSEGLKDADPGLRFGGPGTAPPEVAPIFTALLAHCASGRNRFTGETGVRLDFISVHIKALPQSMVARELALESYVRRQFPSLGRKPFINDEADPIPGWARPFWWEAGPWYAAFVAQNIDWQRRLMIDEAGDNLELISNDDSFLGGWDQRTTHVLFRNQGGSDGFVIIRKPVLTVLDLIAQLRTTLCAASVPGDLRDHVGVIATRDGASVALIVYNRTEMGIGPDGPTEAEVAPLADRQSLEMTLRVDGLDARARTLVEYRIDDSHGNPYGVWKQMGRPAVLSQAQIAQLKAAQRPPRVLSEALAPSDGQATISLPLPAPSVVLLLIGP